MINVIFKDFNYEITPKKKELFDKYNKVIFFFQRGTQELPFG